MQKPKEDPLKNSLIMERIFSFLPFEDKKTARGVCTTWRGLLQRQFIANTTVNARQMWAGQDYVSSGRGLAEFNLAWRNEPTPYTSSYIQGFPLYHDMITSFINIVSANITELELDDVEFDETAFYTITTGALPFQNLRKVVILDPSLHFTSMLSERVVATFQSQPSSTITELVIDFSNKTAGINWKLVFTRNVNLTKLSIKGMSANYQYYAMMESLMTTKKQHPTTLNLTMVNLTNVTGKNYPVLPEDASEWFMEMPINDLSLTIGVNIVIPQKMLENLRNTLTKLEIKRTTNDELSASQNIINSTMPKMKTFRATQCAIKDASFLHFLPSLAEIRIGDLDDESIDFLPTTNIFSFHTLSFIRHESISKICIKLSLDYNDIKKIVKWFPNLYSVQMRLDNTGFAILCENSKLLTQVTLLGRDVSDSAIINNIWKLERLCRFVIENSQDGYQNTLGNDAVLHGFMRVSQLKFLRVYCQVSVETEEFFRSAFPRSRIVLLR